MTFSGMIEKLITEIEHNANESFIVHRDANGGWHCDTTTNQYGEKYDWVDDIKDPFAVTLTGSDLEGTSYATAYDRVLNERLRTEYEKGNFPRAKPDELKALMNMLEENIGEFSQEATDYITLYDQPLAALYDMTPISLKHTDSKFDYDYNKVSIAVAAIEAEVHDILYNRKKLDVPNTETISAKQPKTPDKRNIHGYEEKFSVHLAKREVIFAENPNDEARYLVCYIKRDNPLNLDEYYNDEIFNDYVDAMRGFSNRLDALVTELETERSTFGLSPNPLTAADCLPDSRNVDWENQLIIVKAEILSPEYQSAEHQLAICTGGFGSQPNASGRAVYVEELNSGNKYRYDRHKIEGVADPTKLPAWAVKKFAQYKASKEPPVKDTQPKEQTDTAPPKKPTLQQKMKKAKEKVREADSARTDNGNKTKPKRDERA